MDRGRTAHRGHLEAATLARPQRSSGVAQFGVQYGRAPLPVPPPIIPPIGAVYVHASIETIWPPPPPPNIPLGAVHVCGMHFAATPESLEAPDAHSSLVRQIW